MPPALDITLVGQEMAACAALGAALGGARALFPEKGRAAFLPDVLLVGALLLGLQSYAAALSAGGVLRWYQLAAAGVGGAGGQCPLAAAAVHKLLRGPMQFARKMLWAPVHLLAARWAAGRAARKNRARERKRAKQAAKNPKKNLPRPQRMLYNSNVSK